MHQGDVKTIPVTAEVRVDRRSTLCRIFAASGIPVIGAHKGYTRTHQVIGNTRQFGGGLDAAHLLARANIVTNKNLIPGDRQPRGLGSPRRPARALAPSRSPDWAWAKPRCTRSPI